MMDKHQTSQPVSAPVDPGERTRTRWWGAVGAIEARKTPRHGMPAVYDAAKRTAQMPVGEALGAAATWIRKQRDKRLQPASDVVSAILDKIGTPGAATQARRVAVIVAHPDDEAIGAGAVLRGFPDVTIVHVTDGAPLDEGYSQRKGFVSREEYAQARRNEVVNALNVIGLPPDRIRGLGIVDGEAAW